MDINGTKTQKNLMGAFAGESQARNKYTYFAARAREEGYDQIAAFFEETANNEKEHAEIWYKLLHEDSPGPTNTNLLNGAGGEHYEWAEMYKGYAEDAKAEGFTKIASLFELVAAIEKTHEERYLKLLHNLENGEVFHREEKQVWVCGHCGHFHEGTDAPLICPVCSSPRAVFALRATNY